MRKMLGISEETDVEAMKDENRQLKYEIFGLQDILVALEKEVRI